MQSTSYFNVGHNRIEGLCKLMVFFIMSDIKELKVHVNYWWFFFIYFPLFFIFFFIVLHFSFTADDAQKSNAVNIFA